jgi:hypothetical protein
LPLIFRSFAVKHLDKASAPGDQREALTDVFLDDHVLMSLYQIGKAGFLLGH